jgi:uncharacterized protein YkwD
VRDLRTLLVTTTAIFACVCSGAVLGSASAASGTPHARGACRARHHRSEGHWRCRSHAARNRPGHAGRRVHALTHRATSQTVSPPQEPSIASVLATPCENTELTPEPDNLAEIRAASFCLVNQERARNGELPLRANGELEVAAQGHSEEMVSEDYFAHVAPSGLTPVGRVLATGYIPSSQVGYTIGENIAWGTLQLSTPSAIVTAWIASPEHLANILYGQYRDSAIGVSPAAPASLAEGQPGAVYTQEFGVIVR